jgi:hypothetical protein
MTDLARPHKKSWLTVADAAMLRPDPWESSALNRAARSTGPLKCHVHFDDDRRRRSVLQSRLKPSLPGAANGGRIKIRMERSNDPHVADGTIRLDDQLEADYFGP